MVLRHVLVVGLFVAAHAVNERVHRTSKPLSRHDVIRDDQLPHGADVCDVIVVGMGAAGALLANRFTKTFESLDICVLEQGTDDVREHGTCNIDAQTGEIERGCRDWGASIRNLVTTQASDKCLARHYNAFSSDVDHSDEVPSSAYVGCTWGGTTVLNTQIYHRGTKRGTWDIVERAVGDAEWSYAALLDAFKRIEDRHQTYGVSHPSPLALETLQIGGRYTFDANAEPHSDAYFEPTLHSALRNDIPLIGSGMEHTGFVSRFIEAFAGAFPGRFANENLTQVGDVWTLMNEDWPEFDEGFFGGTFTGVDGSKATMAFALYVFSGLTNNDLAATFPNQFDGWQFNTETPSPAAAFIEFLKAQSVPINEAYKQAPFFSFMDVMGPFATFTNAYGFLGAGGALLSTLGTFRAPSHSTFVYPLLNLSFVESRPRTNIRIIDGALVSRVLFGSDVPGGHIVDDRVVGVEYIEDAREAVSAGLGSLNAECNRTTAARACAEARSRPRKRLYARYDTILSAGAYDTPAILQRSGVGDKKQLESLQAPIRVRAHVPGVGKNLRNHADVALVYESNRTDVSRSFWNTLLGAPNNPYTGLRFKSSAKKAYSNMHAIFESSNVLFTFGMPTNETWSQFFSDEVTLTERIVTDNRLYPSIKSTLPSGTPIGSVLLEQMVTSTAGRVFVLNDDPTVSPHIALNIHGNDEDVEDMIDAIETIVVGVERLSTYEKTHFSICSNGTAQYDCDAGNALDFPIGVEIRDAPGAEFVRWVQPAEDELFTTDVDYDNILAGPVRRFDRAKVRAWIKKSVFQGYHQTATCAMGPATSPLSVLDAHARVYEVRGLRVVDASMFPVVPDVNTMGPTYGAAQRAFELMCEEYRDVLGVAPTVPCKPPTDGGVPPANPSASPLATLANAAFAPRLPPLDDMPAIDMTHLQSIAARASIMG